MGLTNIIISSVLMFNSFDYFNTNHAYKNEKIEINQKIIDHSILINYAVSCELIRQDIEYTKKYCYKYIILSYNNDNTPKEIMYIEEGNIFWVPFVKNNLNELMFIVYNSLNFLISYNLNKINNNYSLIYLVTVNLVEFVALCEWVNLLKKNNQKINLKVPIFTITF